MFLSTVVAWASRSDRSEGGAQRLPVADLGQELSEVMVDGAPDESGELEAPAVSIRHVPVILSTEM